MSKYRIFRSSTPTLKHTVTRPDEDGVEQIENLAGAALLFTAKRSLSDTFANAVIAKNSAVDGGIVITDAANGLAETAILTADTVGLAAPFERLFYDLKLITATGNVSIVEYGELIIPADVSDTDQPIGPPASPPDPTAAGSWLSYTGTANAWSEWALPETIEPGDVTKTLVAISETEAAWQTVAASLSAPVDPDDDGNVAVAASGDLAYAPLEDLLPPLAAVPADPGDDGRLAVASGGDLAYPSGNRYTGGADGSDGLDTRVSAKVQTTDATPTTVATFTPPANCAVRVVAHVVAHEPATGDTCSRVRTATFRVDAGVVTQVGATVDGDGHEEEDAGAAAWDLTILESGGNVIVQFTGEAAHTITGQHAVQFLRVDV